METECAHLRIAGMWCFACAKERIAFTSDAIRGDIVAEAEKVLREKNEND